MAYADLFGALRIDRIDAPCAFDSPINGSSFFAYVEQVLNGLRFLAYVEQVLVPTLKTGDIVVIDNLGSHKAKAVRRALRAVGAKLFFLPPTPRTSIPSRKGLPG